MSSKGRDAKSKRQLESIEVKETKAEVADNCSSGRISKRKKKKKVLNKSKETSFQSNDNTIDIGVNESTEDIHQRPGTSAQVTPHSLHSTGEDNSDSDDRPLPELFAPDLIEYISVTIKDKTENETKVTENQSSTQKSILVEGMDDILQQIKAEVNKVFSEKTTHLSDQMKDIVLDFGHRIEQQLKKGNIGSNVETNESKVLTEMNETSSQTDFNDSHRSEVSLESTETILFEKILKLDSSTLTEDLLQTFSSNSVGIEEPTTSAVHNRPMPEPNAPDGHNQMDPIVVSNHSLNANKTIENETKITENIEQISRNAKIESLGEGMADIGSPLKTKIKGLTAIKESNPRVKEKTNDKIIVLNLSNDSNTSIGNESSNKVKTIPVPINYCAKRYRPFGQTRQSSRLRNEEVLCSTNSWSEIDGSQYSCRITEWKDETERLDILKSVSGMTFTKSVYESDVDVFYCWTAFPGKSNRRDGLKCVMRLDNRAVNSQKYTGFTCVTLYVLAGEALMMTEDGKQKKTIRAGHEVFVPAHTKYAIENRDVNSTYFYVVVQKP